MAYLGNAPARSFISFERQVFTIVNSQTAYALSHSVANENDIRLVVNNVVQEPGSGKAYTATGTALTLSAALTNGTDEMYCVFLGRATATSAPGAGSIGTAQLASDAVTLAKMAPGTDGNIISYDASGNPVAVATGNDGQVLTSAGAGAPPAFETPASAVNTPLFRAYSSTAQNLSNGADSTIVFGAEDFDPQNTFASNTFTPAVAGKYFLKACVRMGSGADNGQNEIYIKNGNSVVSSIRLNNSGTGAFMLSISDVVTADNNDAFTIVVYQGSGGTIEASDGSTQTFFTGFKLIS